MMANRTNGLRRTSRAAALLAALTAGLLTVLLGAAGPAQAAPQTIAHSTAPGASMPDGPKSIVIHPGLIAGQGDVPGDGLPPAAGAKPSPPGFAFEVKRVPGLDLRNVSDWNTATKMTPSQAAALVADEPLAGESTTGADGSLAFHNLETGLYLVTETKAPAGELRSAPSLIALPLPHPTHPGEWLTAVHVYPKSVPVSVRLGVRDADAVVCGDTVRWSSLSAIPDVKSLSSYRVQQVLDAGVQFQGRFASVNVEITGQPALTRGKDYKITEGALTRNAAAGSWAFDTTFTDEGIEKLLVDTDAEVRISYNSEVSEPGAHTNEVRLFAGDADPVIDTAVTKFGPIRILVHERDNPTNLIQGANFRLYTDAADARAGKNAIEFAKGAELTTADNGVIPISCLRASGFADGLDVAPGSKEFRHYFAKPDGYPAGWTGDNLVLRGDVMSATDPETLLAVVWKGENPPTPVVPPTTPSVPPVLTETGGKVIAAVVLGSVLVLVGGLAVLRRRRQNDSPSA